MAGIGQRGKQAEALFKRLGSKLEKSQSVMVYRLPDARAGSLQPTLADFLLLWHRMLLLVEVKEVAHDFRLSYNNFSEGQVGRQRLWALAGGSSLVLIYHSTAKLWRCAPIDRFVDRSIGGSWDLRDLTPGNLEDTFLCQVNLAHQKWALDSGSGSS